jgi:hypothetical protein
LQIGRSQGDPCESSKNVLRSRVAQHPFVMGQQERGSIASTGENEPGRAERRHAFEPQ